MRELSVFCLVGFLLACTPAYRPKTLQAPDFDKMPHNAVRGDIRVGVDPYVHRDRQKAVFDADLTSAGVLLFRVLVQNKGTASLFLRPDQFTLELPDGTELTPVESTAVVNLIFSPGEQKTLPFPHGLPPVGAAGLVTLNSPLMMSEASDFKAYMARIEDFDKKALREKTLAANQSTDGFVYFKRPADTSVSAGVLNVRLVTREDSTALSIPIPIRVED